MDIRPVAPGFAVSPKIGPDDMAKLAAQGFAAVVCNRPDGEEEGQPDTGTLRSAAEAEGMAYHHIPVSGGNFPADAVDAFRTVRTGASGPVLAFCRTGTRAITLEALANPDGLSPSDLLEQAQAAGYDLSGIADRLGT
jgi:sulfide:quinone oxidoreductase